VQLRSNAPSFQVVPNLRIVLLANQVPLQVLTHIFLTMHDVKYMSHFQLLQQKEQAIVAQWFIICYDLPF
jgi:hypothetical protein